MNYVTVKTANELGLEGVRFEKVDSHITAVVLDGPRGDIRVEYENYSGLRVLMPAPPKVESRFHLYGVLHGLTVSEFFGTKLEEDGRINALRELGDADLSITVHDVAIDDDGHIIEEW